MTKEVMKQALDAFEAIMMARDIDSATTISKNARYGLRDALKQEQDEPVGVVGMDVSRPHMRSLDGQYLGQKPDTKTVMLFKDLEVGTNLYTTPPPKQEQVESVSWWNGNKLDKRTGGVTDNSFCIYTTPQNKEWVGLTDEDIENCFDESCHLKVVDPKGGIKGSVNIFEVGRAIEAKLKEKNT